MNSNLLLSMPGPIELLIILIIAVLIFGKRLPEIGRGLGKSLMEFKKGLNEAKDIKDDLTSEVKKVGDDIVNQVKKSSPQKDS